MARDLPPPPITDATGSFAWLEWYRQLRTYLVTTGSIPWSIIDFAGSALSDIASRSHQVLQALQGGTAGEYYHLTSAQHTDLTDAGDSTSHYHATDRARANHTGTQVGTTVILPFVNTPTREDVTDWFNTYPAGQVTGGTISATGTQIEVTAGEGLIKSGSTIDDPTYWCEWSALSLTTITDARVTWVCVDYNSGSPTITLIETTTSTEPAAMNYNSVWPLGYVVREGSIVHVTNNPRKAQDAIGGLIRRFHQTLPLARDELVGGLIVSESGTRNITLSAGYLFDRQNRFTVSALDTSVSGSFDRYYRAVSGFTKESSQTQWPNTQYDDGSGTLVTMTNNRYANLFWYLELDGNLVMLYGRDEYVSAAGASMEELPATVPLRTSTDGKLIARTTFQKSAATFTAIDTVFSSIFSASAATTHNNLAGLQGGTSGEYYHLTSTQAADLTDGGGTTLHTHAISTGITGLGTNVATFLATPSSTNLAAAVTGETGSGALVFATQPSFASTIGVGAATAAASGAGITFPATQSASTDANTLDDYEEGTWTPIDSSGASLSFSNVAATYEKIGRLVVARFTLTYPATGSVANAVIGGLPFTTANSNATRQGFISYTGETTAARILVGTNTTTFEIVTAAGAAVTNLTMASDVIYGCAIYYV